MNAEYQRLEAEAREVERQIRDLGANVEEQNRDRQFILAGLPTVLEDV